MTTAATLALVGGHPALDFANTAGWHAAEQRTEWLRGYGDLLDWARHAGLLSPAESGRLAAAADRQPRQAVRALQRAVEVRELIYRIFARVASGATPDHADLERLQREEIGALRAARPAWSDAGRRLAWPGGDDLLRPVYPIVMAAARLLDDPPNGRLRQCGNHPCGWLFIDRSRSGTRRWCSSTDCGNEVRVRRFRKGTG